MIQHSSLGNQQKNSIQDSVFGGWQKKFTSLFFTHDETSEHEQNISKWNRFIKLATDIKEIVENDIQTIYLFLVTWICPLVPREYMSIGAAVLLTICTVRWYYTKPQGTKTKKKEKDTCKASRNMSVFSCWWNYLFPVRTDKVKKTKHKDESSESHRVSLYARLWNYMFPIKEAKDKHKEPEHKDVPLASHHQTSLFKVLKKRWFAFTAVCLVLISIQMEFVRLYQLEVAKRAALMQAVSIYII